MSGHISAAEKTKLNSCLAGRKPMSQAKSVSFAKTAPRLQSATMQLQASMTKDTVRKMLSARPQMESLQRTGIVDGKQSAPRITNARRRLSHSMTTNKIGHLLKGRVNRDELQAGGIVRGTEVAPALAGASLQLGKALSKSNLYHGLANRKSIIELIESGVYQPTEEFNYYEYESSGNEGADGIESDSESDECHESDDDDDYYDEEEATRYTGAVYDEYGNYADEMGNVFDKDGNLYAPDGSVYQPDEYGAYSESDEGDDEGDEERDNTHTHKSSFEEARALGEAYTQQEENFYGGGDYVDEGDEYQGEYQQHEQYENQGQEFHEATQEEEEREAALLTFTLSKILLKTVSALGREGHISLQQKSVLKDLVVDQDDEIMGVALQYVQEGDFGKFRSNLYALL